MNPLLEKIEQDIEAKVPEEKKEAFQKAVIAGEKIMFDKKTHQNMELIKNPESRKNPPETIAKGVAGLMWIMFMQSKKTMEYDVMIMAGAVLMTKAIDFAERGLGIKFDQQMISLTTKLLGEKIFNRLGITPEMLQEEINKGGAEIAEKQGKTGMIGQVG